MSAPLTIPAAGGLDLLALGAVVHRLDPGIIPFRKAHECQIHVSGGEFNVAANLADCFRMQTGICTAMVNYGIGDLVAERVRAMGVRPFYKQFHHNGVNGPNIATVYSDRAPEVIRRIMNYVDVLVGNEEDLQRGLGIPGPEVSSKSKLDSGAFFGMIHKVTEKFPNVKIVATTLREVHSTNRHGWGSVAW